MQIVNSCKVFELEYTSKKKTVYQQDNTPFRVFLGNLLAIETGKD